MNKRQRKKQYTRAFSKAYNESLKRGWTRQGLTVSTITDRKGTTRIVTSINKGMDIRFGFCDYPELTIEALLLSREVLKV